MYEQINKLQTNLYLSRDGPSTEPISYYQSNMAAHPDGSTPRLQHTQMTASICSFKVKQIVTLMDYSENDCCIFKDEV